MKSATETLAAAHRVLDIEAQTLSGLKQLLDEGFYKAVKAIYEAKGRVIVTGVGKSAIIAQKIVATFNSTGTPSIFMHAADAVHGDLGMLQSDDIVLCLSHSGNTAEIQVLLPLLKMGGNRLIAVVGNKDSILARQADFVIHAGITQEACPHKLAPTSSTAAQMAIGDTLAVCLLEWRNFSAADFARFHPGGALGKRLYLRVSDIYPNNARPAVHENDTLNTVIMEMTSKRLGAAVVEKPDGTIAGIITDGDLRRLLTKGTPVDGTPASAFMSPSPKTIGPDALATDALELMRSAKITQLIVEENGKYLGMLHIHDLNREGLIT